MRDRDPAQEAERELSDMERRSERLEHQIEDLRSDWERKKQDPSVPGAEGDPGRAEGDIPPEADFPGGR
jgi:hypothetical protein